MAVAISLQQADVSAVRADVLLLKYAQTFYGADSAIATALERHGLCSQAELQVEVGEGRLIAARGSDLAPTHILFLGTPRLGQFRYREMEDFAKGAIKFLAESGKSPTSLSTTVHGAGYGLDVEEALEALIRGFERGLLQYPLESLQQIIFVDHNPRRAQLLAQRLAALPSRKIHVAAPARQSPVTVETPSKRTVFVAMAFSVEFEDVYQFGIYQVLRRCGYVCERVDETAILGNIVDHIRNGIEAADFVIADLSGERPNVYLEVGHAWGLQRKVLLLAREGTRLHFDLSHHKCIFYKTIGKLAEELERSVKKICGERL